MELLNGQQAIKKLFSTITVCLVFGYSQAQINIARYYHNSGVAVVNNLYDHHKPDFTWNMPGALQAEINAGINALDENNPQLAQFHLSKAVTLDSSVWISRYYLGICFKKLGNFSRAIYQLNQAVKLNPKIAEPHIELGEIYIFMLYIKLAEDEFDEAIRRNDALPQGYLGQGHIALLQNNTNKAKRLYEKSNEVDPRFAEGYLIRAIVDMQLKQTDGETLNLLDQSIKVNPSYTQGYFWRGLYHLNRNDLQKCLEDWDKLVNLNPLNPFFMKMRGFLYIELNDYSKAFIDLKNAFKIQSEGINENKFSGYQTILDKQIDLLGVANYLIATGYGLNEDVLLLVQKSFCLLLAGRNLQALASINEAELKHAVPSATIYYLKALILENNNHHEQALKFYDLALGQDKDIFEAHRKKCVYHFEMKDYKSAYVDLNEMFRIQPGSPVAHRLRGLIRSAQGYLGPAIADLSAYIKTDTADQIVIQARHMCYLVLKKTTESQKDAEWLLKKAGTNWRTYEEYVSQYLSAGDSAFAVKICDLFSERAPQFYFSQLKALEIYGSQQSWVNADHRVNKIMSMITEEKSPTTYARLYYWKGLITQYEYNNVNEALIWLSKSVKFNSTDPDAMYALADVFIKLGDKKKALKAYELLAKIDYKDSKSRYELLLNEKK
jgi:tetratricopeptide (TPR) repeat protein